MSEHANMTPLLQRVMAASQGARTDIATGLSSTA
jgi:hypothetical protein